MRLSLSTRIALLSLGLLLLVQLAGFVAIRATLQDGARSTVQEELAVGERIWRRLLEQKALSLVQGATLLAADYGLRSAVATADNDTIGSVLENHAARIGAAASAWIDSEGRLRSASGLGDAALEGAFGRTAVALTGAADSTRVAVVGNRVMQLVRVPLKAPVQVGWLVLGFAIDAELAAELKALSGHDLALLAPGGGDDWQVVVSTRPLPTGTVAALRSDEQARVDGVPMQLRRVPLEPGAVVVLMASVDAALAPMYRLQQALALITAAGLVVFGLGSLVTARRVTTPLRALVDAAGRLGRGEYEQPVLPQGQDEVGDLAQAIDRMRVSIAGHEAEIRELGFRDRLTGLPNRAQLRLQLGEQMTGAAHGAVVVIGLNRFKHVNDVLGYAFGDRLLQATARRLGEAPALRGAWLARLGSDQFALLQPAADAEAAALLARAAAEALEQPLVLDEQSVDLSAACGVACWPAHGTDADGLLGRAEVAMDAAKRKTLPCVVYDPAIDSASAQSLTLLSELRRAVADDELRLYLQPKIELAGGRMVGAEALVRWQHPARGMVPPLQFIPFAEQTGFVRVLTLWMVEAGARAWPSLRDLGVERLSVNLSTRDLMDTELPQRLQEILARHRVTPQRFCLEITESAIMDEPQRALEILQALSAMGFKLSIDDFGTGYSSLAYLKRLPVDELKIDKSFVMGMARDADDAKIVRSTIDLAHNLGLSVVAEGVENAQVYELLRELGCDEGQGYHMARPMPAGELPAFASRWSRAPEPHSAPMPL